MTRVLIAIVALALPLHAQASAPAKQTGKTTRAKLDAKPPSMPANPCAIYGAGFAPVQGTSTCIRTGGRVGVGSAFERP